MKDIVRFDLVKINRGREKLCQCTAPCFEVDEENRIVSCKICGAILDPFEALIKLAERPERLEETQRRINGDYYGKTAPTNMDCYYIAIDGSAYKLYIGLQQHGTSVVTWH